jgi:hypothetical protein
MTQGAKHGPAARAKCGLSWSEFGYPAGRRHVTPDQTCVIGYRGEFLPRRHSRARIAIGNKPIKTK